MELESTFVIVESHVDVVIAVESLENENASDNTSSDVEIQQESKVDNQHQETTNSTLTDNPNDVKETIENVGENSNLETKSEGSGDRDIESGCQIGCECCFNDISFTDLIQCTEGHLFCKQCLSRYVEQTVFGDGKSLLKCMNTLGSPCTGFFSDLTIQLSVNEMVFEKFSEQQFQDALRCTELKYAPCFHCNLQSLVTGDRLMCPNCNNVTCIQCGLQYHENRPCGQFDAPSNQNNIWTDTQTPLQTRQRLTLEEAITQARVRECVKCRVKFLKSDGCNRMKCACGTLMCYVCRKDITFENYHHFCQTPHCDHSACGLCVVFTNTEQDDKVAMIEAGARIVQQEATNVEDGKGPALDMNKVLALVN